ncbi:hypothetical protein [Hyunsoonleella pacifica]|uniref:Uncharacterized protein n=1 Tax=Hyunsoonleella pacifica TaxID=1080224 RepID=A0A4Q9FRS0_9FLAO|nr:hypothetical protein [Hyunsoonleella pacifica]TBN16407.1 hypothetical protein EYD46_07110 [Hyunsoonleella pacifica]GGD19673.1 hypothetical protein GCM10011368_22010 [Hyunsoonleella pacifica]
MKKILTIVLAIVGVLSIAFLAMIISAGDEAVKGGEASGSVDSIMFIAYIILGLIVAFVVIFSLKNILTNPDVLKSTLRSLGIFVLLAIICYFGLAKGVDTPLKDGGTLSASGSKLLGAGLYLFYALILIAGGSMLFYGIKKMIK